LRTLNLTEIKYSIRKVAIVQNSGFSAIFPYRLARSSKVHYNTKHWSFEPERVSDYKLSLNCLVISKITGNLPSSKIVVLPFLIPENIVLADLQSATLQCVDLLIGTELFYEVHLNNTLKVSASLPPLQETVFGWVVSGALPSQQPTNMDLQNELTRFWEIDSCELPKPLTVEETHVEVHFSQTVRRQPDGRYVVTLPTTLDVNDLGDSHQMALLRLHAPERRYIRDPELKAIYTAFIDEYLQMNHMSHTMPKTTANVNYYLRHHVVVKPNSSTTKLRVVFDGSAVTSTGLSLNNVLRIGLTIQKDFVEIMLRFRKHRFAFFADVNKMYHQILITEDQHKLQHILWRINTHRDVTAFSLKTVTYGKSCAPFLAVRVLNQLADDESLDFPRGSQAAESDFNVNDCLSGADSIGEALAWQTELVNLLQRGQLKLHKCCANTPELLAGIYEENREKKLTFSCDNTIKTLGVTWLPSEDKFIMSVNRATVPGHFATKRSVSSDIALLFNPLDPLSPVVLGSTIVATRR
jgi:Putative peptidase (DUF1758)